MGKFIYHFGKYLLLLKSFFKSPEKPSVYWKLVLDEINSIGIGSLIIVFITSVFIGAVMTVQTAYQLISGFIPTKIIGNVVSATAFLEMAPTVVSLVLAGKVGSSIAGQLGTMRITEQVDALEVMGINSASYLIMPKIIGAVISFPLLVIIGAFLMHVGGMFAGDLTGSVTTDAFKLGMREGFTFFQLEFMLTKAITFGFVISSISSYQGYFVKGGALEVGLASTRAVVISCIMVLFADYILAQLLL